MRGLATVALLALGCGGEAVGVEEPWFTARSNEITQWDSDIAFGAGLSSWVSVGSFSTGPGIWVERGTEWQWAGHGLSSRVSAIAADSSTALIALDINGLWRVFASSGGSAWEEREIGGAYGFIRGLHRSPNWFFAGGHGAIARSSDGRTWEQLPVAPDLTWRRFASNGGTTVAVAVERSDSATLITDGGASSVALPAELQIAGVTHAMGSFFAVSTDGELIRSETGERWEPVGATPTGTAVDAAGSADALMVVLSDASGEWRVARTHDLRSWREESFSEPGHRPERLVYSDAAGQFALSSNLAVWLTGSRRR